MTGFEMAKAGEILTVALKSGTTGTVATLSSWTARAPEAGDFVLIDAKDENGVPFEEKGIIAEVLYPSR